MNTPTNRIRQIGMRPILAMMIIALVAFAISATNAKPKTTLRIVQPDERYLGKTYPEWAAEFWQWMLGLPYEGHPVLDDGLFDFSAGQSGKVWFWASPEGTITRTVTLPKAKRSFSPFAMSTPPRWKRRPSSAPTRNNSDPTLFGSRTTS
jgi:hypothetical protein